MPISPNFDEFSRAVALGRSRRSLARSLAILLPGLSIPATTVGKGKGGSGRKSKPKAKGKKSKKQNRPRPSCSGGACTSQFVLPDNQEYCEFICRQCDADDDPRHFCIVAADPSDPDNPMKIAVCCDEGEVCCDDYCCPEGRACCGGTSCCREGHTCCHGYCCGTNNPWTACCDGTCVSTENHHDHCGACGNACLPNEVCYMGGCVCTRDCEDECPPSLTRCGFHCVDIKTDPNHCGGCYYHNPNGLKCCDGNLCTYVNGVCCGGTCYPEGWPSCG
jgi:hypothetical protein